MSGRKRGPASIIEPIEYGTAELIPEADRPGCWTLLVNGMPQSHVDLGYPARLHFEYMRHLGSVADTMAPRGTPLRVLHLGGGALAMPRYVHATRPGSTQLVIEHDGLLTALVRRILPLPAKADIRVRNADAARVLTSLRADHFGLVIADFPEMRAELVADIAHALSPDGICAINLIDRQPLPVTRIHATALFSSFADVCLIADPAVLRGKRPGNFVLVARKQGSLPVGALTVAAAREPLGIRVLHGPELAGCVPISERYGRAASPFR